MLLENLEVTGWLPWTRKGTLRLSLTSRVNSWNVSTTTWMVISCEPGRQVGEDFLWNLSSESLVCWLPSAFITYTSDIPSRSEINAIWPLSEDQAGEPSFAELLVMRVDFASSARTVGVGKEARVPRDDVAEGIPVGGAVLSSIVLNALGSREAGEFVDGEPVQLALTSSKQSNGTAKRGRERPIMVGYPAMSPGTVLLHT
jgi:hypothetical protein